jgi:hypothetical protein
MIAASMAKLVGMNFNSDRFSLARMVENIDIALNR